ncbi:PEPxxWA-CTERM sorting domain-containing protein [Parasphingorhabdus sp.]|uniref:PEPxxWA-CTERM sorting domain-containing protein n=1 Tax=Parasphingorhabdus sp. TaxID=2709688 RepID=UPI0032656FA0
MKIKLMQSMAAIAITGAAASTSAQASTVLYDQDFESPTGFVNDGGDINIFNPVNDLYGGQPAGFSFAQAFTVETLLLTGDQAFGTGYSDPTGTGGNYAIGMLSDRQNDLLGLSFNVGSFDFLNLRADISSIDLDRFGGPFIPAGGLAPVFRFSLYDNPTGAVGLGTGPVLDMFDVTGTTSARDTFDWTEALGGLDATGSTNGEVILRIDLLSGQYAAFDNLRIVASNTPGDVGGVPEPTTWAMMIFGFGLIGNAMRRRKTKIRFSFA